MAAYEVVFAVHADGAVAVLLERAAARRILGVDLGHHLVKIELAERVARTQRHRLGRIAFSPTILLADDDPRYRVRREPFDVVDPRGADGLSLRVDHPEDVLLRLADLLEVLLLLVERRGHAMAEVARDLHVREPRDEALRVLVPRGTERHQLSPEYGPEHGRPE